VENSVRELPGVVETKLLFSLGKLEVNHHTEINQIVQIIEAHGCQVEQLVNKGGSKLDAFVKTLGQGGLGSAVVSGIALLFAVGLWLLDFAAAWIIACYAAAIMAGGWATLRQGIKNLAAFKFDMNVLMTVAVIGAVLIGEWLEGAIIAWLFSLSSTMENFAMEKTRQSIKELMTLAPEAATIKRKADNQLRWDEAIVPVEQVAIGEMMVVRPGERVAMDGEVVYGSSWVDESPITGESLLKEKAEGASIYAGSINEGGYLEVKVTKLAKDNTVAKIIRLVEQALAEKPPVQKFIDSFAAYYTPAVLAIAVGITVIPPVFFNQEFVSWLYRALALLLIACPCALVISTPVALVTAMGKGAKEGILIKGGLYLEAMARVKAIAFDKTGTLTKGKPAVSGMRIYSGDERNVLEIAYSLEKMSEHPLARSFCRYAEQQGVAGSLPVESFQVFPGKGVTGELVLANNSRQNWIIGSPEFLAAKGVAVIGDAKARLDFWRESGDIVIGIGRLECIKDAVDSGGGARFDDNQRLAGLVAFRDELRPEAKSTLRELAKLNVRTIMLTGDNLQVARRVAQEVGISQVKSQLLPGEKMAWIEKLERDYGQVAMVGDGINDAPALAKASVGIAMGAAGTDTALETADVALMGDELLKLPLLVSLARKTLQIIGQNIVIALGLKVLAVLLIFSGWFTLWMAVAADMGTSLLVTANGLRLLKVKNTIE
jgi:Cd2+/Zn2+-exporting ATPase